VSRCFSAQQELDLNQKLLPSITLAEVSAAFALHFTPGTFAYVLSMSGKDPSSRSFTRRNPEGGNCRTGKKS
jgi:hypothetical protein